MSKITKSKLRALGNDVDELGRLNAQISMLNAEANIRKNRLKKSGLHDICGSVYRAVIADRSSERLDKKMAQSFLTEEQIIDCTVLVESTSVSLYDL